MILTYEKSKKEIIKLHEFGCFFFLVGNWYSPDLFKWPSWKKFLEPSLIIQPQKLNSRAKFLAYDFQSVSLLQIPKVAKNGIENYQSSCQKYGKKNLGQRWR